MKCVVNFASSQQSQTELRLYFRVCVLQKFQQSDLEFEKSDPQIASWYELAQLRFTTSKNFVKKITVRFKLNWMQAV